MNISLKPDEALRIGLHLHKTGALEDAEMLYRRIIGAEPQGLDALHCLAVLCHQTGRHEETFGLIKKIIAIDPGNADAHNNLGNALEALGRFPEAEAYYRKALGLHPGHAPALNNLGVLLVSQNKLDEAIETYRRAIAIAPQSADFRLNLANALRKSRAYDEAAAAYREVLSLSQDHEGAWRGLARCCLLTGRREDAAAVYDEWLRLDPGNEIARYLRASCSGHEVPERTPDEYLTRVFDDVAVRFDTHLVENLDYHAPNLIAEALGAVLQPPSACLDILDAGCGTGLCAPLLKPYARRLTGVDLSSGMLAMAEARKLYDALVRAELTGYLSSAGEEYDVIASADTLCYFGPLDQVFAAAAAALRPEGLFAFTLEDAGEKTSSWSLDQTARYSHNRSYVAGALGAAGFELVTLAPGVLRNESDQPVGGHIVVARKAGS